MNKPNMIQSSDQQDEAIMEKKSYSKPTLTQYRDIRTLTLGNSPGNPETGTGGIFSRVGFGGNDTPGNDSTGSGTNNDPFDGSQ
jgi:hypothetical protein